MLFLLFKTCFLLKLYHVIGNLPFNNFFMRWSLIPTWQTSFSIHGNTCFYFEKIHWCAYLHIGPPKVVETWYDFDVVWSFQIFCICFDMVIEHIPQTSSMNFILPSLMMMSSRLFHISTSWESKIGNIRWTLWNDGLTHTHRLGGKIIISLA